MALAAPLGTGTPVNINRATELWVCASMKGDAESTYSIAMCFLEGKGCIPKVGVNTAMYRSCLRGKL